MSSKTDQIERQLAEGGAYPDRIIAHKDGTFSAWWAYFYRCGKSAEKYAERILAAVPGAVVVEAYEDFHSWPTTSYFKVKFILKEVK